MVPPTVELVQVDTRVARAHHELRTVDRSRHSDGPDRNGGGCLPDSRHRRRGLGCRDGVERIEPGRGRRAAGREQGQRGRRSRAGSNGVLRPDWREQGRHPTCTPPPRVGQPAGPRRPFHRSVLHGILPGCRVCRATGPRAGARSFRPTPAAPARKPRPRAASSAARPAARCRWQAFAAPRSASHAYRRASTARRARRRRLASSPAFPSTSTSSRATRSRCAGRPRSGHRARRRVSGHADERRLELLQLALGGRQLRWRGVPGHLGRRRPVDEVERDVPLAREQVAHPKLGAKAGGDELVHVRSPLLPPIGPFRSDRRRSRSG